ncbi:hypothetical protein VNKP15269_C53070 (plasmid) [Klebsiella pneumoniae]|nr:hypothetical protein VNKP15269_C53070 [Klebsiella pneumoniae]
MTFYKVAITDSFLYLLIPFSQQVRFVNPVTGSTAHPVYIIHLNVAKFSCSAQSEDNAVNNIIRRSVIEKPHKAIVIKSIFNAFKLVL